MLRSKIICSVILLFAIVIAVAGITCATAANWGSTQSEISDLKPVDAIPGLVAAFKQHPVVIIGERHGFKQAGDFYARLVQDPKFQETVQDIVVEFVSRNNQPLLDRYISGEDVPAEELRHLWRDTTKVASWESPVYANWLSAIREVNRKLPLNHRLRVLAGDTPVDWSRLRTRADWNALGDNNISLSDVIMHEVLEKRHHALVVLGSNHITKFGDRNGNPNTTTLIEAKFPGSTYVMLTLFARLMPDLIEDKLHLSAPQSPALYDLAGTTATNLSSDPNSPPLIKTTDALLYLEPRGSFTDTTYPPESFDYAYVKEVERRSMIEWGELRVRGITGPKYPESDVPIRDGVSPRIEQLKKQLQDGNRSATEEFWSEVKSHTAPLIETIPSDNSHSLVTFVYRGNEATKSVGVYSQLSGSNDSDPAMQLPGTDIWYKTYATRSDMHIGYSFVVNSPKGPTGSDPNLQTADPLNPKAGSTASYMGRSALELPNALSQPWLAVRSGVPTGKLEEVQIDSKVLKSQRQAWVYTPASYDPKRAASYPLLVCFDGLGYASADYVPGSTILDNLMADGKIPPMIMVLVGQSPQPQRNIELGNNQPFLDYVANELLPNVRQKWHATSDPKQTVVCGSSSGGLASAFFALKRPDVFGNVLSQSGAFWPGHVREDTEREWLTRQYESSPKLPVKFVLQVGVVENGHTPNNGPSILTCNRHLRDVLYAKGNELYYSERAGGHEPLNWSQGLAEGLVQLMGRP